MPAERNTVASLQEEISALIYSVSHDVRAPLRSITGFSEALLEDYADRLDEQGVDYLHRIQGAAARMDLVIRKLVELAQISQDPLRIEPVDVSALAESIADGLKAADPGRNVHLSIEKGLMVHGDPRLLQMALAQLLGNAWKFTSKHPTANIELGSEERDGHRVLYVRDDGAGFEQDFAKNMFAPFQRLHPEREFEGAGIGLAIVQRIVHRHAWRVWAAGKVDQGTTVFIEIS